MTAAIAHPLSSLPEHELRKWSRNIPTFATPASASGSEHKSMHLRQARKAGWRSGCFPDANISARKEVLMLACR